MLSIIFPKYIPNSSTFLNFQYCHPSQTTVISHFYYGSGLHVDLCALLLHSQRATQHSAQEGGPGVSLFAVALPLTDCDLRRWLETWVIVVYALCKAGDISAHLKEILDSVN